jgi:hypothetical protein
MPSRTRARVAHDEVMCAGLSLVLDGQRCVTRPPSLQADRPRDLVDDPDDRRIADGPLDRVFRHDGVCSHEREVREVSDDERVTRGRAADVIDDDRQCASGLTGRSLGSVRMTRGGDEECCEPDD